MVKRVSLPFSGGGVWDVGWSWLMVNLAVRQRFLQVFDACVAHLSVGEMKLLEIRESIAFGSWRLHPRKVQSTSTLPWQRLWGRFA